MELKFAVDTKHRKGWFTGMSFSHPAKMSLPLQLWLIENYTKAGETILDPMAGSGTVLVACSLGRNVIAVELEQKFIDMMHGNWEKIKQRGAQMGYSMGACQIIKGDARQLEGLLVDKIITSPPYAETVQQAGGNIKDDFKGFIGKSCIEVRKYSDDPNNLGNLSYGDIDAVITSPPYEGSGVAQLPSDMGKTHRQLNISGSRINLQYSDRQENIGNLKSQSYLEAMLAVYRQCLGVLKAGGLLILVTKNFIRNKQIIRLDLDTIQLCEQAGFGFVERHYRKLPAQSFWRIIYMKKHPEVEPIEYEDILVFRKG